MSVKLYVGNLPFKTTEQDLKEQFSQQGMVVSAQILVDRFTGRSLDFGFIEMSTQKEAEQAIKALHGVDLGGRILVVNEARPLQERRPFRSSPPQEQ